LGIGKGTVFVCFGEPEGESTFLKRVVGSIFFGTYTGLSELTSGFTTNDVCSLFACSKIDLRAETDDWAFCGSIF